MRRINRIRQIARDMGIQNWNTIKASTRDNKRAMIISPTKKLIHFGQYPYDKGTFIDHGDTKIRDAWRKRHMKIKNKDGNLVYKDPESASYYSFNLLW